MDIKTTSTHIERKDRRLNDDWLEIWLEDWGAWRRSPIKVLDTPMKTAMKIAEELRPDKVKVPVPRIPGKPYWYSVLVWELKSMWKGQIKTTNVPCGTIPNYMPHIRMSKLNRIIQDLPPQYRDFLIHRFEKGESYQDMSRIMSKTTYFRRLASAKKLIKKCLQTWE